MRIRPVTEADYEAVGDLCVAAYVPYMADEHYFPTLRDVAGRAAVAEVLVAEAERLLGTVTFVPDGGPLGEIAREDETEFRMLAVDPAAQGRGVAIALMEHIIAASRELGRRALVCSTRPGMQGARHVYGKLGFTRDPARDWSPLPGVDLIAFALLL